MAKKSNDEFVAEMKELHPDITLLEEYKGYYEEIKVRHSCGCEYMISPQDLSRKQADGCSNCKSPRKTHEQFVNEMAGINPNVEVVGTYKNKATPIKIRFKDCGHSYDANPTSILSGRGCRYCTNNAVLPGFNDIATTAPWMVKYLVNKDDATKYSCNSHMKVPMICPECGLVKEKIIQSLYREGICCTQCSDGISYPNKFGRAFLEQLPISNFKPECEFEWSNHMRYDNYFEYRNQKYILEMDGGFHFKTSDFNTLDNAIETDALKDKLTAEHGITMIRIDCKESQMNYIKENILNSVLNDIFDLSEINWEMCDEKGAKKIVKDVCEYFEENKYKMDLKQIADHSNISVDTLRRYRRTGENTGWCTPLNGLSLNEPHPNKHARGRKVNMYDANMNFIKTFKSACSCAKYVSELLGSGTSHSSINDCCKNSNKSYRGYYFRYSDDVTN